MAMDLGTAIPISTGVFMAGMCILKYIGRNRNCANGSNSKNFIRHKDIKNFVPRKEIMDTFKDKFKNVVYGDTCDANIKGFEKLISANQKSSEKQLELVQKHLSEKIDSILTEIKNGI